MEYSYTSICKKNLTIAILFTDILLVYDRVENNIPTLQRFPFINMISNYFMCNKIRWTDDNLNGEHYYKQLSAVINEIGHAYIAIKNDICVVFILAYSKQLCSSTIRTAEKDIVECEI